MDMSNFVVSIRKVLDEAKSSSTHAVINRIFDPYFSTKEKHKGTGFVMKPVGKSKLANKVREVLDQNEEISAGQKTNL